MGSGWKLKNDWNHQLNKDSMIIPLFLEVLTIPRGWPWDVWNHQQYEFYLIAWVGF